MSTTSSHFLTEEAVRVQGRCMLCTTTTTTENSVRPRPDGLIFLGNSKMTWIMRLVGVTNIFKFGKHVMRQKGLAQVISFILRHIRLIRFKHIRRVTGLKESRVHSISVTWAFWWIKHVTLCWTNVNFGPFTLWSWINHRLLQRLLKSLGFNPVKLPLLQFFSSKHLLTELCYLIWNTTITNTFMNHKMVW